MRTKIEVILLTVLIGAVFSLYALWNRERTERIRVEGNQEVLLSDVEHYKTADSLNVVKLQTLELTQKELEQSNIDYQATIDKLNIKNKRLLSLTQVQTETKIEFKTIRKDSVVYVPGKDSIVHIECLEYKDPFVEFSGCYTAQDSFQAQIRVPIKLDIAGSYEPKRFLGIIPHGIDYAEIDIISDNKYTDITWAKSIKLKRKRNK